MNLKEFFDLDNMPPKRRRILIRIMIVLLCILTTLAGILFSVLTM